MDDATEARFLTLPDERRVGYAVYGDLAGAPLVWFPGTPGSRLARPPDEEITRARGVRMITVERPGFGISTPHPTRTVLGWADDMKHVADELGLERFALAGTSGAGPYLCACAIKLAARITRLGLIGVVAPIASPDVRRGLPLWRRFAFAFARHTPRVVEAALVARGLGRDADALLRALTRDASPPDRKVLDAIWPQQVRVTREGIRQGIGAFVEELHLAAMPWGFDLADIRVADVRLWHGTLDRATPIAMGRYLAQRIPNCHAEFIDDAGHFLHFERWEAILAALVP
jgi:pimeloyl-ACP methyl ester carboxylesterase